jgi:predicted kinase
MKLIILMSGYTATGKTTTANKIAKYFETQNIKCAMIRSDLVRKEMGHKVDAKYFDDNNKDGASKRDVVYLKMLEIAKEELEKGSTVILDAGHNKRFMRERVYKLSKSLSIPLVLVNSICEDEKEIEQRISKRGTVNPLEVANKMEVYKYSKGLSDPINEEVPIIKFDTVNQKIISMTDEEHTRLVSKAFDM